MTIRPAGPSDARRLAELRFEFRAAYGGVAEARDAFLDRCEAWMTPRLAEAERWRCWVEESDGVVVGHVWLQLIEKLPNPVPELERHGYVTNMYVTPERRGAGVGARLLEHVLEFCREHEVDSVVLWPSTRSRPLYVRFGFETPDDVLELVVNRGRREIV